MSAEHSGEQNAASRRKWLLGVGTAVLIAVLTAAFTGLGEKVVDAVFPSHDQLLSYGLEELGDECGVATYLPTAKALRTVKGAPPYELEEWAQFRHQPGAAYAGSDLVRVSIQGESERKITLTGIDFEVSRRNRSDGMTFSAACGDALRGRGLHVDLDADPPQILTSSETTEGIVTAAPSESVGTSPISFPWTVSLTDPLLLYVLATSRSCDCTWTARIPWVSGSKKGSIKIDNGGDGYRVVGSDGLAGYSSTGTNWRRYE
jgi:hypothetical protein